MGLVSGLKHAAGAVGDAFSDLGSGLSSELFGKNKTYDTQTGTQKQGMADTFRGLDAFTIGKPTTTVDRKVTQDYYQNAVLNPALRQYDQQVNPAVKAQMANQYWGTSRQKAQQSAMQNLMNQANNQYQEVVNKDRMLQAQYAEEANNRALQAAQLRGQLASAQTKQNVQEPGKLGQAMQVAGAAAGIAALV